MEHETYRYHLPGLLFFTPIFIFVVFFANQYFPDRAIEIIGTAAALALGLHLITGWLFYHIYRAFWIGIRFGYEKQPFIETLRKLVKVFPAPRENARIVDLTAITEKPTLYYFTDEQFRLIFNPFRRKKPFGIYRHTLTTNFCYFLEGLSDIFVFKNCSYNYARSISSVRYSINAGLCTLLLSAVITFLLFYYQENIFKEFHEKQYQLLFEMPLAIFCLIFAFISLLLFLLLLRKNYAKKEYIARLCLIESIDTGIARLSTSHHCPSWHHIENCIPKDLLERLDHLNAIFSKENAEPNQKIAVFDLDNTLVSGDIGEAVFAQLTKEDLKMPNRASLNFNWETYQQMLHEKNGKVKAYRAIVTAMAGLPLNTVLETTRKVLQSTEKTIDIPGASVPVPKPFPEMHAVLIYLKLLGYRICVVTASNQWSAETLCKEFFAISETDVFGVKTELQHGGETGRECKILSERIVEPCPIDELKAEVYRQHVSYQPPIIVGGDSHSDLALFNLLDERGLAIWAGSDDEEYESIKREVKISENFIFLKPTPDRQ